MNRIIDQDFICEREYEELLREQRSGPQMLGTVMAFCVCVFALLAVMA